MNKRQKELAKLSLEAEKKVLDELEKEYARALRDINKKVLLFAGTIEQLEKAIDGETDDRQKEILISQRQSKVYQKKYQEALQGQISGILDKMQGDEYATIEEYLKECYEDGYIGTLYDLQSQGIPLIMPIDQAAAVKAIMTDSKISKGLYTALGVDIAKLKKTISSEITRGIASSRPYAEIARNLSAAAEIPKNRAKLITRTEGHRIQSASNYNACVDAKAKGADVVKQWSAALDARTRPTHRALDGQIVEVDEPFSLGNKKAMFPGDFGDPAEDCNCRCRVNQRARWALDESELDRLQERAKYFGLDKAKDFEDYKQKYLKAVEDTTEYLWSEAATDTDKIVLEEINKYYGELTKKYGIKMDILGDKLADLQADWDMSLKWNVQEYMKEHPKVSKKQAESIVKKTRMAARPEKETISIMEGGQYWHDTSKIIYDNGEYKFQRIKKIIVNQLASDFSMTFKESEAKIQERFAKIEKKRAAGRTTRLYLSNATEGGAGTFLHEYGHAIDFTKGIAENPKFREWYDTLTEDDICEGLSSYAATNPNEFIAEAFAESFFPYQRPMSKKFMKILEEILSEE